MVAGNLADGLADAERASFEDALAGRYPVELAVAPGPGPVGEGRLAGGCLSLLNDTLGTPWAADLDGAVVFLEETDEPFYRFDRMLTHLRLSGNLAKIRGMVSGHLIGVDEAGETERHGTQRCRDLLRELARGVDAAFAWGLDAGHSRPNMTLPLGMWARLDPERASLLLDPTAAP